jgi:hypothetical protein
VDALDQPISIAHIWLAYVQVSIKRGTTAENH